MEATRLKTMSLKRSHTTELGCIACEELSDVGAGKEGWLAESPNLHCALHTHSIAIANRSIILVTGWDDGPRLRIRPELSPIESEIITALEWLAFDEIRVIAVATSRGYLLVYSLDGHLVHRQMVYPRRIIKLRVCGTKKDLTQDSYSEEVSVVMPGVIARFDGSDIQNMLQEWFQETHARFWDEQPTKRDLDDLGNSYKRLPYQLWNVGKYGSCADAAITGIMPPPLMEVQSSQCYYHAITMGENAVISANRHSEDRSRCWW